MDMVVLPLLAVPKFAKTVEDLGLLEARLLIKHLMEF